MQPSLDPEIAAWLTARGPVDDEVSVAVARAQVAAAGELWDFVTALDPAVVRVERDVIAGVPVVMWEPVAARTDRTVIAVHGGGFTVGDARGAAVIAAPLAIEYGVRTVSVDYRLAPEWPFPAAAEDVGAVVSGLVGAGPLGLWADSAGAAIALSALDQGRRVWAGTLDAVDRIALVCPALDDADCADVWSPCLGPSARRSMWRHYLTVQMDAGAAAVPARMGDVSWLPPTLIIIAEHDLVRAEAQVFAERLHAAGVQVESYVVPGTVHGFTGLLHHTVIAQAWNARVARYLAAAGD